MPRTAGLWLSQNRLVRITTPVLNDQDAMLVVLRVSLSGLASMGEEGGDFRMTSLERVVKYFNFCRRSQGTEARAPSCPATSRRLVSASTLASVEVYKI